MGSAPGESFEPTLSVPEFQTQNDAKGEMNMRPEQLAMEGLALFLQLGRSQREPMAMSAPPAIASKQLVGLFTIGEERSASLKSRISPLARSIPLRTL